MILKNWMKTAASSWSESRSKNLIKKTLSKTPLSTRAQTLWLLDVVLLADPNHQNLLTNYFLENEADRTKLLNVISKLLIELDVTEFFSDYGLIETQSFLPELLNRIIFRFLPEYQDPTRFSTLCDLYLHKKNNGKKDVRQDRLLVFMQTLETADSNHQLTQKIKEKIMQAIHESLKILYFRIAALVTDVNFRERLALPNRYLMLSIRENDFDILTHKISLLLAELHEALHHSGISIELIFRIERIKEILARMSTLQPFSEKIDDISDVKKLMSEIIRAAQTRHSIRYFLKKNLSLISKKIVEQASLTGEHYIARSWLQYRHLFFAAAGGGLLTAITALTKSTITHMNLPLFVEGCLSWINYSFSFYLMQLLGFTLATKTPALTATVLAAKIKKIADKKSEQELVVESLHVIKSGFLAALGNVIFVIIGAIFVDKIFSIYLNSQVLTLESALEYFEAHHPFHSLTIWYAAYTGVILWLGSSLGGWFENWFVFRKLPQAIAESDRLNYIFGARFSLRISQWLSSGVMAFAVNIALGFLLAFSTIGGKFFGLPLDVRHVTLSSGALAFSLVRLQNIAAHLDLILYSIFSIFLIGFLNFSISFIISFIVAANAREVELKDYPHLIKLIFFRLFSRNREAPR